MILLTQDILIDMGEEHEEDASSSATFETAKSSSSKQLSEAVSQSEMVPPTEAVLASDSTRRSEALSQGAPASAELDAGEAAAEAGEEAAQRNDDGKSGMASVSEPYMPSYVEKGHTHAYISESFLHIQWRLHETSHHMPSWSDRFLGVARHACSHCAGDGSFRELAGSRRAWAKSSGKVHAADGSHT